MDLEHGVIMILAALVSYRYLRPRAKPLTRLVSWLAYFFIAITFVQVGNDLILNNLGIPEGMENWARLPLQLVATCVLVVYMPIREESEAEKAEKAEKRAAERAARPKRRFKKS